VEEEMLAFLGLVINMRVIRLPYVKGHESQGFLYKFPFLGKALTRKRLLHIFWMLHLKTVSNTNHSWRTRTQKVRNFLKYMDARCKAHFIPGQNLPVNESVVQFKGRKSS
jgi:hypothetical protein